MGRIEIEVDFLMNSEPVGLRGVAAKPAKHMFLQGSQRGKVPDSQHRQ